MLPLIREPGEGGRRGGGGGGRRGMDLYGDRLPTVQVTQLKAGDVYTKVLILSKLHRLESAEGGNLSSLHHPHPVKNGAAYRE